MFPYRLTSPRPITITECGKALSFLLPPKGLRTESHWYTSYGKPSSAIWKAWKPSLPEFNYSQEMLQQYSTIYSISLLPTSFSQSLAIQWYTGNICSIVCQAKSYSYSYIINTHSNIQNICWAIQRYISHKWKHRYKYTEIVWTQRSTINIRE